MLAKLKINNFKEALALPQVDKFDVELLDGYKLDLTIHEGNGRKVAVIHSPFQVYGWTEDMTVAFDYKHNACIYTAGELWNIARGKKI